MYTVIFRFVVILVCVCVPCISRSDCTQDKSKVIGVYETVSESEWNIIIDLQSSGDAKVTIEMWNAGEYDKRQIDVHNAKWSIECSVVSIKHSKGIDQLRYSDHVSYQELGEEGDSPGLTASEISNKNTLVDSYTFWKSPRKKLRAN